MHTLQRQKKLMLSKEQGSLSSLKHGSPSFVSKNGLREQKRRVSTDKKEIVLLLQSEDYFCTDSEWHREIQGFFWKLQVGKKHHFFFHRILPISQLNEKRFDTQISWQWSLGYRVSCMLMCWVRAFQSQFQSQLCHTPQCYLHSALELLAEVERASYEPTLAVLTYFQLLIYKF